MNFNKQKYKGRGEKNIMEKKQYKKVVLAYSGGLDTSIIISWLKENYGCEVIAVAGDVGQADELEGLEAKALATGASKYYVADCKEEFVNDFIFPAVKANAMYEGKYLLGTSLARPIIAKKLVDIAKAEGADAICHGCTGKGNDQVRFELTIKAFAPDMDIIAPWRTWELKSREDEIEYAEARNIPLKINKETNYSYMTLTFEKGEPVALNGEKMNGVDLILKLNELGGANGIGIIDMVENRLVGMKSRGVYETPGGTILYKAHGDLEEITLDKETQHFKQQVSLKLADILYNGQWYTPLTKALLAFIDETQKTVNGEIKLKLYKGNITNAGMSSPDTLYSEQTASFGEDEDYNQMDSQGFINLYGLPIKVKALLDQQRNK